MKMKHESLRKEPAPFFSPCLSSLKKVLPREIFTYSRSNLSTFLKWKFSYAP